MYSDAHLAPQVLRPVVPAWMVFCSSRSVTTPRQVEGLASSSPGTGKKNVLKVGPGWPGCSDAGSDMIEAT